MEFKNKILTIYLKQFLKNFKTVQISVNIPTKSKRYKQDYDTVFLSFPRTFINKEYIFFFLPSVLQGADCGDKNPKRS